MSVCAGAVGALYGPLHGGANEAVLRMLERIGSVDRIDAFLEGVKAKKEKMFGFGHRCAANLRCLPDKVSAILISGPVVTVDDIRPVIQNGSQFGDQRLSRC